MKNIGINKLCAYVIGAVVFFIQPCESVTYLNRTNITLQNGGNIDRFSFRFRTCLTGVLLREERNNLTISIIAGNETKHSFLRLSWEDNNSLQVLDVEKYISIDTNVEIKVEVVTQENNSIFAITNLDVPSEKRYSVPASKLDNLMLGGNFILGSDTFSGCFYSGTNINIDSLANTCSWENLKRCDPTADCPRGFTGRYCETNIDECASNDSPKCHSFSTCVDKINGFKCICGPQWNGTYCDKFKGDLCLSTPCLNEGTCTLTEDKNNYTCTCVPYTSGRNCEHVNHCSPSRCQNGGTCSGNSTGFTCRCLDGTSGIYCENKENPCADVPCDTGQCTDLGNGNFTCNCSNTGLYGDRCQSNINECAPNNPCEYNGTCKDLWGSYKCKCMDGYDGTDCEINIDDCLTDSCNGRGNCTDKVNAFECQCNPGFNGSLCENNINECLSNPCNVTNSEPCKDGINQYICPCKPGYNGNTCDTEINECDVNPCENNAPCVDSLATYNCICLEGFEGVNCSTNKNECSPNPCAEHGRCVDGINKYTCMCDVGYVGDTCLTNENNCDPDPCLHNGVCKDLVDDYNCTCIPSYIGRNCTTYRDPCAPVNPCQNGATCNDDEVKGFKCNCSSEYDGDTCQFRYSACYPNHCIHGNCIEDGGTSYNCSCISGYVGRNCTTNVNECASNPCKNGGTCIDGTGTHICICPIDRLRPNCVKFVYACNNYKGDFNEDYCTHGTCKELGQLEKECKCNPGYEGERCKVDIDECTLGYCKHNSNCTDLVNDYNCTCVPGYINKNCSVEINECEPDPCKNGATCTDMLNDYKCACEIGYEGKNCSVDIDWCEKFSSPCINGGTCTDDTETYTCACVPGFSGKNCSNDIDECTPNPCVYQDIENNKQHESTCVEKSNETAMRQYGFYMNMSTFENRDGFICVCLDGLNGTTCSNNIENCTSTTCDHNATCTDLINDFYCGCHAGYTGKRCEIDIDECGSNPCEHNATCTDLINDYNCTCRPNFVGRNCSVILSNCSEHNPCQNGTTTSCYFDGSNFTCMCADGFGGKFCTDETNINLNGIGYWKLSEEDLNRTDNGAKRFTLSMSFATTLRSGRILYISFVGGSSLDVYIDNSLVVIVIGGRRFEGSSNRDQFNSGKWHTIVIDMMELTGSFKFDDGPTHTNASFTYKSVESVYIGGAPVELQMLNYTGCIRDVRVGDEAFTPSSGLVGNVINGSCSRTPVCNETSCSNGNGDCVDNWLTSECNCATQYFGKDCGSEISSFSFGEVIEFAQNTTNSRRRRNTGTLTYAFSNVTGTLSENSKFTFRIRTRQGNSLIAVLVNRDNSSSYLALYLNNSKLSVKTTGLTFSSQGVLVPSVLDDGIWHEIILSTRIVSDDGKETGISLPSFNVSLIYFGGVDPAVYYDSTIYSDVIFDGCLQAVKLKGTILTSQSVPGRANATLKGGVKYGCPSNNPCNKPGTSPCAFGDCADEWFAYSCTCPTGFHGENCSLYGCAVANSSHPCRNKLNCVDVPSSPGDIICSQSLTFNGVNSTASLKLENITIKHLSFAIQTRQREAFLFASYKSPTRYFVVGIKNGSLLLYANYSGAVISLQGTTSVDDGARHDIDVKYSNDNTSLTDNNRTKIFSHSIINDNWLDLLSNSTLVIGLDDTAFIRTLFSDFYFGAFTLKQVGQQTPVKSDFNYTDVSVGWHSSNPCKHSPCKKGECHDTFNDYYCACPQFYTKKDCDETVNVSCSFGSLCKNNGTCEDLNETMATVAMVSGEKYSDNGKDYFKCRCYRGFTGFLCGNGTDECVPNPCKNNGICTDKHLDYKCDCSDGYQGLNCSENIDDCDPNPCENNGTCVDLVNDYQCQCFLGRYKGKNCTEDVNECNGTNPCSNRGNCTNKAHGYDCACNNGSFGDKCQYNSTQFCAAASPCNHGTCLPEGTNYICKCDSAYTGVHCNEDHDECELKPCKNNGTCNETAISGDLHGNGYNCTCTKPFEGLNCTIEKDPCENNPCVHGNCSKLVYLSYRCDCESGFVGTNCAAAASTGLGSRDKTTVIVIAVVVVIVVIIIAIILFICYYKKNSGQQGTYNPGYEENKDGVPIEIEEIKKPKVERLI